MSRAPLGVFFHRLMGATAALPLAVAAIVPPAYTDVPWTNPVTLAGINVVVYRKVAIGQSIGFQTIC